MRAFRTFILLSAVTGCTQALIDGTKLGASTGGGTNGASSSSSSSTSGATTGNSSAGASTGGGSTTAGVGSSGGSSTGGSSTGPLPPIVDGGYVFCTLPDAADAGPHGDGGLAFWLCPPGTYLCGGAGDVGNCFQCLSDADCANQSRPTYDPRRPRCDLSSGITGYQNYCQVCLADGDCAASPDGPLCDLNPFYPEGPPYLGGSFAGSEEPSIAAVGFETCGAFPTDCRMDGGPICIGPGQFCQADSGVCRYRSGYCSIDSDCPSASRYCVSGRCFDCGGSDGTCALACFGSFTSEPLCPLPLPCGLKSDTCACRGDSDCGGLWPRCRLDAGLGSTFDPLGVCGCDDDAECGDGGLICTASYNIGNLGQVATSTMCGLPCTSPAAPACASLDPPQGQGALPVCEPGSGICVGCTNDQQCKDSPGAGGPVCTDGGGCGCTRNSDCRGGESCLYNSEAQREICIAQPRHCTPLSCDDEGIFCDWDSGQCVDVGLGERYCLTDFDCPGQFCNTTTHGCQLCVDDLDCRINPTGTACIQNFSGQSLLCGCRTDSDCAGAAAGADCSHGSCGCSTPTDCPTGEACTEGTCGWYCLGDSDCQSGSFCLRDQSCRARCDDGGGCPQSQPLCDATDSHGQAGEDFGGPVPGALWCYPDCKPGDPGCPKVHCDDAGACPEGLFCDHGYTADCVRCVNPIDCPGDQGCNSSTHACGSCKIGAFSATDVPATSDCPPGDICSNFWSDGLGTGGCLPSCDLRSCPADRPICAVLPALTPDHAYCFGCLTDADCSDAGTGAWCDDAIGLTFTCKTP